MQHNDRENCAATILMLIPDLAMLHSNFMILASYLDNCIQKVADYEY